MKRPEPPGPALCLRHGRWWRGPDSQYWICEVCHPPAAAHLATERFPHLQAVRTPS